MDKFRVLIVEDEAIVSMALRRKLEAMGYTRSHLAKTLLTRCLASVRTWC